MKIIWSPRARTTLLNILNYLEKEWGENSVHRFITEVTDILMHVSRNPKMFISTKKNKYIRKGIITKHISLYYRIKPQKKEIELLTFWDNRQDPKKLILSERK
jgi:plasmid stabilization system protein ParE